MNDTRHFYGLANADVSIGLEYPVMGWMESIGKAIGYIEDHITKPISVGDIAGEIHISPFYFQKGFSLLCGYTAAEYIRKRRLTLDDSELVSTVAKVIDIALKYGYDSSDSFTKAHPVSWYYTCYGVKGRRSAQIV